MDYLYEANDTGTEFSMAQGTCACCGTHYTTDPDQQGRFTHPITQEKLDSWEKWLYEQLTNVYKCRQTRVPSSMLKSYNPTMELAWEVAIIKARRLGISWRDKELPDHAHDNEMQAELAKILDWYQDITDHVNDEEPTQDILSDIFFEEYVKMTCKRCEYVGDPTTFYNADYCTEWCANQEDD